MTFYNLKPEWPAAVRAEVIRNQSLGRIYTSYPVAESYSFPGSKHILGFGRFKSGATIILFAPHWFPILVAAAIAIIPWMPSRFSLRTLLIATALIAVALSVIVLSS